MLVAEDCADFFAFGRTCKQPPPHEARCQRSSVQCRCTQGTMSIMCLSMTGRRPRAHIKLRFRRPSPQYGLPRCKALQTSLLHPMTPDHTCEDCNSRRKILLKILARCGALSSTDSHLDEHRDCDVQTGMRQGLCRANTGRTHSFCKETCWRRLASAARLQSSFDVFSGHLQPKQNNAKRHISEVSSNFDGCKVKSTASPTRTMANL